MTENDLLYPAEAAKLCGVTVKTLTHWAKDGLIPVAAHTLGGHRRYSRTDLQAILDGRTEPRAVPDG